MSGSSYDAVCPLCGGTMYCSNDYKPHEYVSGDCIDCGFTYWTQSERLTLAEVNKLRVDSFDLEPLTELKKQENN